MLYTISGMVALLSTLVADYVGRLWFQTLCSPQCHASLIGVHFDPLAQIEETGVMLISNHNQLFP